MRTLFFIFLSSLACASGPKYSYKDAKLNDELDNVYKDIGYGKIDTRNIKGTRTNDNATAGSVGEYISATSGYTNFPTTSQWGDMTSISLTSGDWDVTVNFEAKANGATVTAIACGISTTSGNSSSGLTAGDNLSEAGGPTAANNLSISIPAYRVSISATTTYYLKYFSAYTVGTAQAAGRISARRVR